MGVTIALAHLRGTPPRGPIMGVVHGLLGADGLFLLITALQGPRRGDAMGVGSFGLTAAVLFGVALTLGLTIPLTLKRKPALAGLIIATHATIAITAFVLFLAWASMGEAAP